MVHRNFHLNIAKQTTPKTWQYYTFSTEDFNPLNLLHLIFSRTWDWVVYRLWLLSFVLFSKHLVAAFVWLSSTYPAVELHRLQGTHVTRQNLSKIIISFFNTYKQGKSHYFINTWNNMNLIKRKKWRGVHVCNSNVWSWILKECLPLLEGDAPLVLIPGECVNWKTAPSVLEKHTENCAMVVVAIICSEAGVLFFFLSLLVCN